VVFGLPALVVEGDQLGGGVGQAGEQPPLLGAGGAVGCGDGDRRLDDPDREQRGEDAVADPGQAGSVGQMAQRGGAAAGGRADQELRAASGDVAHEFRGVEPGVGQQRHGRVQRAQQRAGAGQLPGGVGAERGGQHGAGAALDQGRQPQQRVAELLPLAHAPG
jgi:hypothetical protein